MLRGESVLGAKQKVELPPTAAGGFKPRMLLPSPQKKIFEYIELCLLDLNVKENVVAEGTLTSFM